MTIYYSLIICFFLKRFIFRFFLEQLLERHHREYGWNMKYGSNGYSDEPPMEKENTAKCFYSKSNSYPLNDDIERNAHGRSLIFSNLDLI